MITEVWKDISGYEGLYQVSNIGRVKSLCRVYPGRTKDMVRYFKKEAILVPVVNLGYHIVILSKEKKCKKHKIHRLVANAFIEPVPGKKLIDHINSNRSDNRVENLRWCTHSENSSFSKLHNRVPSRLRAVSKISVTGEIIKTYSSIVSVKADGYEPSNVSRVVRSNCGTHAGFRWVYMDNLNGKK